MVISNSLWRKTLVTVIAVGSFISLYEVTALDSRFALHEALLRESTAIPAPGARVAFMATAYCKGVTTASGVPARSGVAAADPALLPVGSVIQVDAADTRYDGIYTIMDTGPAVQGRQVDIYMWSCNEALSFGRQTIRIGVLRLGWNPQATQPASMGRLNGTSDLPLRPRLAPAAQTLPEPIALPDGARE